MLNILGALGAVSRLLPNYVEGQRAAVQDNWRDMQQYNQAQLGQLQNMFIERTLPWKINMTADEAARSRMLANVNLMSGLEYLAGSGGRMGTALASNIWAPQVYESTAARTIQGQQQGPDGNFGNLHNLVQQYLNSFQGYQGVQGGQQTANPTYDVNARLNQQTQTPTSAQ